MGLFSNFRKKENREETTESTVEVSTEDQPVSDVLLRAMLKGESINREKALSIPAVSSAVDRISNVIASLPINLYERKKDEDGNYNSIEKDEDERVKILNQDTGDTLDCFQLKKAIARDYLINKGAYIYIEKDKTEFKSLRYINPDSLAIAKNNHPIFKDTKYLVYSKEYETYDFLTILRNTQDGASGKSAVEEISKSIETAFTTILYELGLVQKGGAKKGFLTANHKLGKDEIKTLKKAWKDYYGTSTENVIVLNEGLEFKEGASTSVELQMNERKKTLKEDINDVFHMNSDYNTFIKDGVMPIIKAIESALNKNFLKETEKGSFYFSFNTEDITRGSLKERYEAYKLASETGWLGKNEIRAKEDKNPIKGLDVISMNLADVLFDMKTQKFYTPNTGSVVKMDNQKEKKEGGG